MNRDNNPLICFVVILGASLRGIWGEYLSFRNLKRPKTVKNGQTADYQIVLRFFRVFSLRLRTESRPQKRPIQTVFWRMVKNLCLGVKIT